MHAQLSIHPKTGSKNCRQSSPPAFVPPNPLSSTTKSFIRSSSKSVTTPRHPKLPSSSSSTSSTTPRLAVATPPPPPPPPAINIPARYTTPQPQPPCTPLVGHASYNNALQSHPRMQPIIIMFHARWCRTCKTLRYKLLEVAAEFQNVVWYDVDFTLIDNKPLCRDLGVKVLPTFRIYLGGAFSDVYEDQFSTGPFGSKCLVEHLQVFYQNHPRLNPAAPPHLLS